jgi:autophagy-related protein 13
MSETKRAMSGQIPAPGRPLVVEISLKTAEGDSLVLEWWRLAVVAGGDSLVRSSIPMYRYPSSLVKLSAKFRIPFSPLT